MGMPAAKEGDKIVAVDIHIVMIPSPGGPIPTPLPNPFNGIIDDGTVASVLIGGKPAAVLGSSASNDPDHIPQGSGFQVPPTNLGTIISGSSSVLIGGSPAARMGDTALTCNDPSPMPVGTVVAAGEVLIGG